MKFYIAGIEIYVEIAVDAIDEEEGKKIALEALGALDDFLVSLVPSISIANIEPIQISEEETGNVYYY